MVNDRRTCFTHEPEPRLPLSPKKNKAKHSRAEQSKGEQIKATRSNATRSKAEHSKAKRSKATQSKAQIRITTWFNRDLTHRQSSHPG